ncbi:glycosyltransferase family 2 protein [Kitasatospora azatica]|uniref:glycosyltransferase family 2 protein n=1 Tax=Kitasatospora azatica TaxID=58347 RepID=UPI00068FFBB7|nr:glycosyltransferase [Kitasatospora azatica]
MNGSDRCAEAACPRLAARDSLYTPVRVVELDLDNPWELRSPAGQGPAHPDGRVLALVRLHGHPLGLVSATGAPGHEAGLCRALVDAAHRELAVPIARHLAADAASTGAPSATSTTAAPGARPCRAGRARVLADPPAISAVVATHKRVDMLRGCLDSLLRTGYPWVEVIVVDNAPDSGQAAELVRTRYPGQVRYLAEPVPGVASAHNRALPLLRSEITAFADDDTLVDADWPFAIAETFARSPRIGCVTGLILPAELATAAQATLQAHGDYEKGFEERSYSLDQPPDDPLFPFAAGRFGSGANMAFHTELLRRIGGFDPVIGTGTRALGGEDLLSLFRVVASGSTLAYQPESIVWHRHRRNPEALPVQAFNYGAGLAAYVIAAVLAEPRLLPALLRRLPRGIAYALSRARIDPAPEGEWSRRLSLLELQGLLYGPVGYLRSRYRARQLPQRS